MVNSISVLLKTIKELVVGNRVRFTDKADKEIEELGLGLDDVDICGLLLELNESDFKEKILSMITAEWMYVFLINVERCQIYLKLIIRKECIIISFHEDYKNE